MYKICCVSYLFFYSFFLSTIKFTEDILRVVMSCKKISILFQIILYFSEDILITVDFFFLRGNYYYEIYYLYI